MLYIQKHIFYIYVYNYNIHIQHNEDYNNTITTDQDKMCIIDMLESTKKRQQRDMTNVIMTTTMSTAQQMKCQ